jgi:ATP-dependent DNA helicase RecG
MEAAELLKVIARGEDSRHQFKEDVTNANSLGAEIAAFANSGGGQMFIGVSDDGSLHELDASNVKRLNQLISNAASTVVRPAINPQTENVAVGNGVVVVVTVADGLSKPYVDNTGAIWVKSGSDKRKVTAREEMQRMFQSSQLVYGDDVPIPGTSVSDIDVDYFRRFFRKRFEQELDELGLPLAQVLTNMRLLNQGRLTISGRCFSPRIPRRLCRCFTPRPCAIRELISMHLNTPTARIFTGGSTGSSSTRSRSSSETFAGSNVAKGVNTEGILEVPRIVFEELLANAFIHRDYFVSAPIRIFVFDDRVDIISPGHLPNNLTVDNIRCGNSNIRNPILASYATKVLPYRGLGNGIVRALKEYPEIELVDDRDGNKFVAVVRRPLSSGGR